jgi:hypothetical protein
MGLIVELRLFVIKEREQELRCCREELLIGDVCSDLFRLGDTLAFWSASKFFVLTKQQKKKKKKKQSWDTHAHGTSWTRVEPRQTKSGLGLGLDLLGGKSESATAGSFDANQDIKQTRYSERVC